MKKLFLVFGFSLLLHFSVSSLPAQSSNEKIEWISFEQAVEAWKKQPKKFIIDVYTDWCGWCKKMDATTFHDPRVVWLVNQHYYAVKMDGEYKKDIEFRNRIYKFVASGRRGYHELPAELMQGKMSYPTIVFLDDELNLLQPIPGYRTAGELNPILAFFGADIYKTTKWEDFLKNYDAK